MAASKGKAAPDEIELRPDGWERFEKAVDAAVRTPAQHRTASVPKAKERPASKDRVHKAEAKR